MPTTSETPSPGQKYQHHLEAHLTRVRSNGFSGLYKPPNAESGRCVGKIRQNWPSPHASTLLEQEE